MLSPLEAFGYPVTWTSTKQIVKIDKKLSGCEKLATFLKSIF